MNPVRYCVLVLIAASSLFAQGRLEVALSSKEPDPSELMALRTPRIAQALRSADSLWAFVTLPEPFFLDRRAAARQGGKLIPLAWMPKLWRAIGELRREEALHNWGLDYPPVSAIARFNRSPKPPHARTILEHLWTLPDTLTDYPLTPEERERAPWPWQVQQALWDLYAGLIPSTYSPLDRDQAEAYLAAVLTMPCNTDEEAQWIVDASQGSSHFKTPAIMAVLRNIAVNPKFPLAATRASGMFADATRLWDDPQSWWIGYAGTLDILRQAPKAVVDNAAYWTRDLRLVFRDGSEQKRPLPAEVILQLSRLALDPKTGSDWTRLYVYAFSVLEALDQRPFQADRRMDPQSPQVQERLIEFRDWYKGHTAELEALASEQKAGLETTKRLLDSFRKCAGD
jgi:hypothetical protein